MHKSRKEIKPIVIGDDDDEPIINDLDTKVGIDTQMQDSTVAKVLTAQPGKAVEIYCIQNPL